MTDIILNQHAPGGVMKQLGDAAGGIIYDQYAPGGCYRQLYTAAGVTDPPSQYAPGGPLGQVETKLEGGGSPSVPAWVPANAKIHIDLVGGTPQGRAWVAGTGEVAVDTLLGTDANTDTGWGTPTVYNPSYLGPFGYTPITGGIGLAFIGVLTTAVVAAAGATLRIVLNNTTTAFDAVAMNADGSKTVEFRMIEGGTQQAYVSPRSSADSPIINNVYVDGGDHTLAFTLTRARGDLAVNGRAAVTATLVTESDIPADGYTTFFIDTFDHSPLASITLYDPLPSTAGLSALSQVT